MAAVDPHDDGIQRYVVRRYAWDPLRHERRHQIVAAFDDEAEFLRTIKRLSAELERRRAEGQPIDRREHLSGLILEAGHSRRQHDARLLREATRHGVTISDDFLRGLDLPSNVAVLRSSAGSPAWPPTSPGRSSTPAG